MGKGKDPHTVERSRPIGARNSEVKVRRSSARGRLSEKESSESLLTGIARATRRPGIKRTAVFRSGSGRKIYAYSVMSSDTSKIVREDARGAKTIGKLVDGRFRALKTKTA